MKYVTRPIKKLIHPDLYYRNYLNGPVPYEEKFKGFMVFSKPKYKPGDTVRLKAFVEKNNGKLVNSPLVLRLSDRSFLVDTILAIR